MRDRKSRSRFVESGFHSFNDLQRSRNPLSTTGDPERVVLHFHPRLKPFIVERDWHDTQDFEELPNGIIVLAMDVPIAPDIVICLAVLKDTISTTFCSLGPGESEIR